MQVLTKADITAAKNGVYECREAEKLIEAAKAIGCDCTEHEVRCQHLKQFHQSILEQFKPDGTLRESA